MEVIKIMSVGKSGVGKSTIGNCLIHENPNGNSFVTSSSADSCTRDSKWVLSKDVHYCDLPGIPDTNPRNTKKFYDILIEEARKELNVILFVFKYERIDNAAYSRAKMLFRELKKAETTNILVINDMTNYASGNQAKPNDYEKMANSIKERTGLSFAYFISMTWDTMLPTMKSLKEELLCKTEAFASPNLKTYVQLKSYVDELTNRKNYEEAANNEAKRCIKTLERTLNTLEVTTAVLSCAVTIFSGLSMLTFGAPLAASAITFIDMKKKELQEVRNSVLTDKIEETTRLLEEACKSFQELDNALKN